MTRTDSKQSKLSRGREDWSFSSLNKIITRCHLFYNIMKKVRTSNSITVLLILAYIVFFQERVPEGTLKTIFNIFLIILMILMIIETSLSLYHRFRNKGEWKIMTNHSFHFESVEELKTFLQEQVVNFIINFVIKHFLFI